MATHHRTCPLCEAMCGLEIETEGDQVVRIRGDRDDVWSKGFLCPKGASLGQLHHDPDRIREPMVREGDTWREVTWEEAFARCEELLQPVVAEHGRDAVTAYLGNPNVHSYSLSRYSGAVPGIGGLKVIWSAGTVDQWPKNLACAQLYGGAWSIPIPDVANTDLFVVMGANPQASNGSILAYPDLVGELDRIRDRGGRTIVVDPRRTGTAERADEWLPIRPGTDAALLLAVVQVLDAEDLIRLGAVEGRVQGIDEVLDAARGFTPEAVADWCGIDADRIRGLARELATTPRAVVYGRIGLCNQEFGTLASWLVEVVNILTGHLDQEGGSRFSRPAIATMSSTARRRGPVRTGRWRTRVRGAPEVLGQAPLSCLAEEIDTPGEGQVKALITIAGNPVLSAPDAGRLDAALPLLDAMISVDTYLNETTRHAHVILPGLSFLEQPHCDEAIWGFALRAVARWSPPVFDPGDRPHEWEIMLRLGAILAGVPAADVDVEAFDREWYLARAARHGVDGAEVESVERRGPDRIVDLTLRSSPFGDQYGANPDGLTLDRVAAHPHGIDLGPSNAPVGDVLRTTSGDVELAHADILGDLDRLRARMAEPRPPLVLIGRRHVRSNNSWMHNLPALMRGRDRSTLVIHPDDAAEHGVDDGALVEVRTARAAVIAVAEISDELVRGVVSLPHGFGHHSPGARLGVAAERPGPNTNVLIPPTALDEPSGNAAVNGVPVSVTPAPAATATASAPGTKAEI
ncbi:molybdopterin-dependent oxidoreductase [Rhabdothermincola salaria]|uniref:molybdopterin-dependent oxidoreductase n=1 Tax=Rhabdothermincola salaria TaxID=2903142 RepID=UPI001E319E6D|nr:molybdopterin-dependent oxidoreductase [Rhabdothermincola salaria]MCD9623573.1 molybdopterin-dependent oxidoreductase [Rhabdothermincola salaria]